MLSRLRQLRTDQSGFTLIEQLVVIGIVGIMSAVTVSLIAAIFDSNIRSGQMLDQQSTIESSYGFLAGRLSLAQKPVGLLTTDNAEIDPLTVAGDQLMWKMGGTEGNCVRAFYERDQERVRVKLWGDCSDNDIRPKRGPNDPTTAVAPTQSNGAGTNGKWDVGEPLWDPAIDLPPGVSCETHYQSSPSQQDQCEGEVGAAVLADGLTYDRPAGASETLPEHMELFIYRDEDNDVAWPGPAGEDRPDAVAKASSTNSWYNTLGNRADVASIDVTHYVEPLASAGVARVKPRSYQQNFTLQQVCAPVDATTGSTTPGAVFDEGRLDGTSGQTPTSWKSVPATSGWLTVERAAPASSPTMTTSSLATGEAYLEFSGQVAVRVSGSGGRPGEVRVQLLRNDVPQADTDMSDGRATFVVPYVTNASPFATVVPLSGKFLLPRSGGTPDPAGTSYKLRVQLQNLGGGAIEYNTDRDYLWLNYRMVARD